MLRRILLTLTLLAAPALAAVPSDLQTTTTTLGHLAAALPLATLLRSRDNSRLLFPTQANNLTIGDRQNFTTTPADGTPVQGFLPIRMILDGNPTPASLQYSSPVFSIDSHHVGYALKVRDHWHVIMDDKTLITDADAIANSPIAFSPDSQHVATIIQKDYRWQVTVDDKPWPPITAQNVNLPSFSPDGKHLLCIGHDPAKQTLYLDGVALTPLLDVKQSLERIAPAYTWKPDSSAIGFAGTVLGKHWQVFTTDAPPYESPQYDAILSGSPVFSPDSARLAYGAQSRRKWSIITTTDASPLTFDEIAPQTLTFLNPDSTKKSPLLYIARRANLWQLYLDHHPLGDPFDTLLDGTFTLSPNKQHYAFAVTRAGTTFIIRDGKTATPINSPNLNTLTFSPDSRHLAYPVRTNNRWHIAIDNQIGPADFASIAANSLSFSPDSQTLAFTAELNPGAARLYIGPDAAWQSTFFDSFLPATGITWRDATHLVTIATTKHIAYRVEAQFPLK